jgi:hypothetical protein
MNMGFPSALAIVAFSVSYFWIIIKFCHFEIQISLLIELLCGAAMPQTRK